jgi:peptide-methionine (S)-S-oxide reductase
MKRAFRVIGMGILALVLGTGCQSKPLDPVAETEPASVVTEEPVENSLATEAEGETEPVETEGTDMPEESALEIATFGSGCFWCTEAFFQEVKGVKKVESGYSGGAVENPTYKAVCSGLTGHAEVVQVAYDPEEISFTELLEIFFQTHDPTTLNRQGADVGTQYRSAIFYHSDEQKETAEAVKAKLDQAGIWPNRIVTEITPFDKFYVAEDYHQDYFALNPNAGYCQAVIMPKLDKFRKVFEDKLANSEQK